MNIDTAIMNMNHKKLKKKKKKLEETNWDRNVVSQLKYKKNWSSV